MRRALRAGFAIVLVYLLQSTLLPYLKVRGVQLDLMTIVLFALGGVLGMYQGIFCGIFAALILECVGGDIAGFNSVFCIGAGAFGAYITGRMNKLDLPGNRGRERMIRFIAPKAAAGVFVAAKESIYVTYFFLTGVSVAGIHVFRVIFAAVETAAFSFALAPLVRWWIEHRGKTRAEKKAERRKKKAFAPPVMDMGEETEENKEKKKKRSFFDDLRILDETEEEKAEGAQEIKEEEILDDFEGWRLARPDEEDEEIILPEEEPAENIGEKETAKEENGEVTRVEDEG